MKKTSLIAYAVALSLAAPVVFAQGYNGPGPGPNEMRHDEHQREAPNMADHDHQKWSKGNRIPPEYRRDDLVVNDWQARHLRRPPRGYHWVRADNDIVLVAISSGIIADILLNH